MTLDCICQTNECKTGGCLQGLSMQPQGWMAFKPTRRAALHPSAAATATNTADASLQVAGPAWQHLHAESCAACVQQSWQSCKHHSKRLWCPQQIAQDSLLHTAHTYLWHSMGRSSNRTPQPSSWICRYFSPPSFTTTVMCLAPASREFSTISFRADAGRCTTSPAAILCTTASSSRCMAGGCAAAVASAAPADAMRAAAAGVCCSNVQEACQLLMQGH